MLRAETLESSIGPYLAREFLNSRLKATEDHILAYAPSLVYI